MPTYCQDELPYYAACCYRPSGVVCLSVGLSVTVVSPAKTVEPIEMPFGLSIGWAQGNIGADPVGSKGPDAHKNLLVESSVAWTPTKFLLKEI